MEDNLRKEVLDKCHQLLMRFTAPTMNVESGVIRHDWTNSDASVLFHQYMKALPHYEVLQSFPITIEMLNYD